MRLVTAYCRSTSSAAASVGGQASPGERRRGGRRRGGRGGADRGADPQPLAAHAHPAARQFRLLPRSPDGLVREEPRRLLSSRERFRPAADGGADVEGVMFDQEDVRGDCWTPLVNGELKDGRFESILNEGCGGI